MTVSPQDLAYAQRLCADFQRLYFGPNPLNAGEHSETEEERDAAIAHAWHVWSSYARNYLMAMLNTLGGCKPIDLHRDIERFCSPEEAMGGNMAMEVFWRRELSSRGPAKRYGGVSMTALQYAIIADEETNAAFFAAVDRQMEAGVMNMLRNRRAFLRNLLPEEDHMAGLREDTAWFFAAGRPARLPLQKRNENFEGSLF